MPNHESWDWGTDQKLVADLNAIRGQYEAVHEFVASPDGERIAAPVMKEADVFGVCVNGELWAEEEVYEKAWHLLYAPDGRLTALVRVDDMWTVAVEGERWPEEFEFAWNTKFNVDGDVIGVQTKQDAQYGVALNGVPWEQRFLSCRDFALSPDGRRAAALVQVEELPEADIAKFLEGTWSVAVDGVPWEHKFLNVYGPAFSPDGAHLAAEVRLDQYEYTLAVDGAPWGSKFGCIWEPLYRPGGQLLAPVRAGGAWTLAEDGQVLWSGRYTQLWRPQLSPDGQRIAAPAAVLPGQWTVIVDDVPWKVRFNDAVLAPVFSPDGARVAVTARTDGAWRLAVDGQVWPDRFDMAWDPVFSPDGQVVLAKVEHNGVYTLAANGRVWNRAFEGLWDPVFGPDGKRVLIRAVEDGKYTRQVVPLTQILQG